MDLLSSLNSGFAAAANGTAEIYIRGSSTRATWYPDLEASSSNSSGANITLDAYGSALVYVNQLVTVIVKNASGGVVRSYVDGYSAPNIEVISPAFTGIDYVTAASAVSEPTTLQAVLDRWATNAGAPDWKVLINGTSTTMLNALGALSGLVYNVKSPAYGAVGDGVTNDQTAIAACLAAAVAAGGGIVFFPKGTYLITTAIEWDHRVSVLGVGASLSVITINSPSNARILTWTVGTAATSPQSIIGVSFAASQANTGEQLYSTVAVNLVIDRCLFGGSSSCTGDLLSFSGASKVRILSSRCTVYGTAKTAMTWSASTVALVQGCHIDTGNTTYTGSFIKASGWTTVASCIIDQTINTLGVSPTGVEMLAVTDRLTVRDTKFLAAGQNFTQCVKLFAGALALTQGNDFGFSTWYNAIATPLGTGSRLQLLGHTHTGSALQPHTIQAAVEVAEYRLTGLRPTFTMPTMFFPGQRLVVFCENKSGVLWTADVSFSGSQSWGTVVTQAADSQMVIAEYIVASPDSTTGIFSWVGTNVKIGSA